MEIRHHPRDLDFSDKRVTVVGLGIEGVDVARYLSRQGAMVTVSDSKPRQKLSERLQQVDNLGLKLALGSNRPDDIAEAEAVFISQGVPLDLPGMASARARGVPVHSMMGLFMELCPVPIAGISGSSGQSSSPATPRLAVWGRRSRGSYSGSAWETACPGTAYSSARGGRWFALAS